MEKIATTLKPPNLGNLEDEAAPWTLSFSNHSWTISAMWQSTLSCWKRHCHQGIPLISGVLGLQQCLSRCQSNTCCTWMPGPKVSQQNIAQSIALPPSACLLPILLPSAISSTVKHPHDVKENVIHQTRPASITPQVSSDAHYRCFQQWTGVSRGTLAGLRVRSPIRSKLRSTVCSDTRLSEPALSFPGNCATVALQCVAVISKKMANYLTQLEQSNTQVPNHNNSTFTWQLSRCLQDESYCALYTVITSWESVVQ